MSTPERPSLFDVLRRHRSATGNELRQALGVSQPTLSRLVAKHREDIVVLGRARAVRYAAKEVRSSFRDGVKLYRVRADGRVSRFASMIPLVEGQFAVLPEGSEPRLHPGLPWFVEELRPQGFLGRLSVCAAPDELQLPRDARLWSSEQLLRALVHQRSDLPGDLLVGEQARDRYVRSRLDQEPAVSPSDYADVIEAQLAGEMPGSSAGGEQPKFACLGGSPARPLLVKYSPLLASGVAAKRWADLLRCEELALQVFGARGHEVARARYDEHHGRGFLEIDRFDRTLHGRRAVVTGTLLDAEFVAVGEWMPLAHGLVEQERLTLEDAAQVELRHLFGGFIANSDMHLGNVAFFTDDYERFELAPLFDMLPMALRPNAQGDLPASPGKLVIPVPTPENVAVWSAARELGAEYWSRVREMSGLDAALIAFAESSLVRIEAAAVVARRVHA